MRASTPVGRPFAAIAALAATAGGGLALAAATRASWAPALLGLLALLGAVQGLASP